MAFCTQCGAGVPEGARFCPACGASADTGAASASAPIASLPRNDYASPPAGAGRADAASPAASYASPPPGERSSSGLWVLPVIFVIALIVIGIVLWGQRDGARPVASTPTVQTSANDAPRTVRDGAGSEAGRETERGPARVTDDAARATRSIDDIVIPSAGIVGTSATTLDRAFYADRARASEAYPGPVRVTGTIATMVTPAPNPALSLEGRSRFNYVIVNFPEGYNPMLAPLRKGQVITVTCSGVTSLGETTLLQGCAL